VQTAQYVKDGYGKDYRIMNLKKEAYDAQEVLMLANALSYYEQKLLFEKEEEMAKECAVDPEGWGIAPLCP